MYQNRSEGHCRKHTAAHIWLVKIKISGVIKTTWNAGETAEAK